MSNVGALCIHLPTDDLALNDFAYNLIVRSHAKTLQRRA
jgi:hypothetical protein